jgi:GT2 family glycosyltransferase
VTVTVIVPVYKGVGAVERCLRSVARHAASSQVPTDLLVIDDASPEPEVAAFLTEFFQSSVAEPPSRWFNDARLLRNEVNLGFVGTVNRGLAATAGDVVILNADTVVTEGWLDRLAAVASADDVATVTPLTNSGSLATLPASITRAFGLDGPNPRIDECAAFVGEHTLGLQPDVISGVGFCMYVTRRALDACGPLDVETFGKGYGEEVDFCLRAARVGFRHVVDDTTFVFHEGAVSFGPDRQAGLARGSALLHERYPFFKSANTKERGDDPLRVSFTALELGLSERESRPHVLHLLHAPSPYGGTEKHLDTLMRSLFDEYDFSILYPNNESNFVLHTCWNVGGETIEHEFLIPGASRRVTKVQDEVAATALRTALDMWDFDAVHIQNLIGHSLSVFDVLAEFDGEVVCSVRDLYLACPNHSLLYLNEQPCGIPEDLSLCARCLPETQGFSLDYLEEFRAIVDEHIDVVDTWVFASQSAADYLMRAYDLDPARVALIPHGTIISTERRTRTVDESLIFDEPLRLAFVGRGWAKKGLTVVNHLAETLAGTGVELHHFGEMKEKASPAVHTHGPYDNAVLPELLHRAGIQIVLLPGPYAETFGHVMTEAIIAGLPVIGARYGALGERIRAHGVGWTVEPTDARAVEELVRNLDLCRQEILRATRRAQAMPLRPVAATADQYAARYRPRVAHTLVSA